MAVAKKRSRNEVRSALRGWVAWTPLLAVFAVIAADTMLSIQARNADYEFGKLAAERRRVTADLDRARSEEAQWKGVGRIAEIISRLNMMLPDPEQIQVVVCHPDTPLPQTEGRPRDVELEMAAAPARNEAATPTREIPAAPAVALPVVLPAASAPTPAAEAPAAPLVHAKGESGPAVPIAAAIAVAAVPAPPAPKAKVLDLPKETIQDLDSPDAPTNDLLAHL